MEMGGSRHFPFTILSPNNKLGLLGIPLCDVGAGGHDDIFAQGGVIITVANKQRRPPSAATRASNTRFLEWRCDSEHPGMCLNPSG